MSVLTAYSEMALAVTLCGVMVLYAASYFALFSTRRTTTLSFVACLSGFGLSALVLNLDLFLWKNLSAMSLIAIAILSAGYASLMMAFAGRSTLIFFFATAVTVFTGLVVYTH